MFSKSMWSLWIAFFIHLAPVWSFSRTFRLTNSHNAVCLKVEELLPETSLRVEFPQPETDRYYINEIPVVIFNYTDILNTGNLPNFVNFTDLQYTNKDDNAFLQADDGSPAFFFFPGEGLNSLPDTLLSTVVKVYGDVADEDEDERGHNIVNYTITTKDTYCIYLPRYAITTIGHEEEIFPHPFQALVTIEGEKLPHNLNQKTSLHKKVVAVLATLLAFMIPHHTSGKAFSQVSLIPRSIIKVLAISLSYYAFLLVSELLVLNLPAGSIQQTIHSLSKFVGIIEADTIVHLQDTFLYLVYVGYGTVFAIGSKTHPIPLATKWILVSLGLVYFGTISLNHFFVTPDNAAFESTTLNSVEFEVFGGTIVFAKSYQIDVLNGYLKGDVEFIKALSNFHVISTILLFIYSLFRIVKVHTQLLKLARTSSSPDHKASLKRFRYSVGLHYILFKLVLRPLVGHVLIAKMVFTGYFDFNRLLEVVPLLTKQNDIVTYGLKYTEFIVLWLIWGLSEGGLKENTVTEVKEKEGKKKESKKTISESKKSVSKSKTEAKAKVVESETVSTDSKPADDKKEI